MCNEDRAADLDQLISLLERRGNLTETLTSHLVMLSKMNLEQKQMNLEQKTET